MAFRLLLLLATPSLLGPLLAQAHFTLDTPPSIGFQDSTEDDSPCGGFDPDLSDDDDDSDPNNATITASNITDFHITGQPIQVTLTHPQANWLFRAAVLATSSLSDANWTQLFPVVQQSGLGQFCQPAVAAPAEWVGQRGVLSVVANAPDGLLYQCAIVKFVAGTANASCTNGTSVQGSFVSDATLAALLGDDPDYDTDNHTDSDHDHDDDDSSGSSSGSGHTASGAAGSRWTGLVGSLGLMAATGVGMGLVSLSLV